MTFHEILVRERKRLELSQEALAGMINVSRQAVSKWETGDAMPDLPKLLALADALGISLDELCGRESPSSASAIPPTSAPRKSVRLLAAACILLCILLAGSLVLLFSLSAPSAAPSAAPSPLSMTEELSISGLSFHGKSKTQLAYQFTPSITGEGLTYQITFTDPEGKATTINTPCSGGVCSGQTDLLYGWMGYTVTISVTDGVLSRNLAVAQGLIFYQGRTSWTPLHS